MDNDAHWTEAMRIVGDLRRDRPALVVTVYQALRAAYAQGQRDGMAAAAGIAEAWARPQQIRMHAGEMTAQEARTGKALLNGVAAAIRSRSAVAHDITEPPAASPATPRNRA